VIPWLLRRLTTAAAIISRGVSLTLTDAPVTTLTLTAAAVTTLTLTDAPVTTLTLDATVLEA
jgi:hypothetical protein